MWEPWIGARYNENRTLLLGESCYDWDCGGLRREPQIDHPIMIVNEAMTAPDKGATTIKKLTRAICGHADPSAMQAADAWQRYAFTNYIPISIGHGAASRPASNAWKLAEGEWQTLLARLKPQTIVVLGRTMWSHMPQTQKIAGDYEQGYELTNGSIAMCFAGPHPSRGPSWTEYADLISNAENRKSLNGGRIADGSPHSVLLRSLVADFCIQERPTGRKPFKVYGPYDRTSVLESSAADKPVCYALYDANGLLKYIGMSKGGVGYRARSHFAAATQNSTFWKSTPASAIDLIEVEHFWEAPSLEAYLILRTTDARSGDDSGQA